MSGVYFFLYEGEGAIVVASVGEAVAGHAELAVRRVRLVDLHVAGADKSIASVDFDLVEVSHFI